MNHHYCTYFDRGFAMQGLTLVRSILKRDPVATVWVLALDEFVADVMARVGERVRMVHLGELERTDSELIEAKSDRTKVEYYFTLSPCWPRWILGNFPEVARVVYVDADMFLFSNPTPIFAAMDSAGSSVLVTSHRFPEYLRHYERHGIFNVGVLAFRNDADGMRCLDEWRRSCLEWCHDRLEDGKYADQKYLESWPGVLGPALIVLENAGVNLAPWNWATHRCEVGPGGRVSVDGGPLVLFHFARFRPSGKRWWQSGQLDYGIMPMRLRNAVYGPYVEALKLTREELARGCPRFDVSGRAARNGRGWRGLPMRAAFGGDWLLIRGRLFNFRFGLGKFSGRVLARLRRIFGVREH